MRGPYLSRDGANIALLRDDPGMTPNVLEVMRADGTGRTSMQLPAGVRFDFLALLQGGTQAIVHEQYARNCSPVNSVFLATFADKSLKRLFTLPCQPGAGSYINASPDGSTVLFDDVIQVQPAFFTIDLSSLTSGRRQLPE
jgi:hypothetical protein